jgi:hypothetical protein
VLIFGDPTEGSSSSLNCRMKVCDYDKKEMIMMVILEVFHRG